MGKWKFAQVAQAEDLDGRWLADLAKRAARLGHDVAGLDIEGLEELIRGPADEPELAIVVGPEEPLRTALALVAKCHGPEIAALCTELEDAVTILEKAAGETGFPPLNQEIEDFLFANLARQEVDENLAEVAKVADLAALPVEFAGFEPGQQLAKAEAVVAAEAAEEVSVSDPIVAQVGEVMRIGSGEHYVVDMTNGEVTPKVIALPTIVTTTDEEVNPMDVLDNGVDFEAVLAERGGLSEMLLRELRGLAKQRELSGYSRLSRGKLIGFLNGEPVAPTHIANVVAQVKAAAVAQRDQPVTIAEQVAEQVVTYADRVSFARKDFQPFEEIVDLLHTARADTRYKGVEHHKIQMRHVDESGVIKEWDTKTINSAAWIGHGWQARLIKVS